MKMNKIKEKKEYSPYDSSHFINEIWDNEPKCYIFLSHYMVWNDTKQIYIHFTIDFAIKLNVKMVKTIKSAKYIEKYLLFNKSIPFIDTN